jgi:hypothetical protein
MFRADNDVGIVEIGEVGGLDIDRADRQAGDAAVEAWSGAVSYKKVAIFAPRGASQALVALGLKKPGWPNSMVVIAENALRALRGPSPSGHRVIGSLAVMPVQNSSRRSSRFSRGLPAIMAELMAPMETPASQSGSSPASCSA